MKLPFVVLSCKRVRGFGFKQQGEREERRREKGEGGREGGKKSQRQYESIIHKDKLFYQFKGILR